MVLKTGILWFYSYLDVREMDPHGVNHNLAAGAAALLSSELEIRSVTFPRAFLPIMTSIAVWNWESSKLWETTGRSLNSKTGSPGKEQPSDH